MSNVLPSDAARSRLSSGDDPTRRLAEIMAQSTERLLKLQNDMVASVLNDQIRLLEVPMSASDAMASMWQLPGFYRALFGQVAGHARQSCEIISQMHNDMAGLVCDAIAAQGPVVAQVIAGGNAAFVDRRTSSVVINFPDRRGMVALVRAARDAAKRPHKD